MNCKANVNHGRATLNVPPFQLKQFCLPICLCVCVCVCFLNTVHENILAAINLFTKKQNTFSVCETYIVLDYTQLRAVVRNNRKMASAYYLDSDRDRQRGLELQPIIQQQDDPDDKPVFQKRCTSFKSI